MIENPCLYHKDADKTLCGKPNNAWLTARIDFPVEDLCPRCLEQLQSPTTAVPNWISVEERLPEYTDFVWVRHSSNMITLAYFVARFQATHSPDYTKLSHVISGRFQNPYTVGDYEGLSAEYLEDITHWAELQEPAFHSDMDVRRLLHVERKGDKGNGKGGPDQHLCI